MYARSHGRNLSIDAVDQNISTDGFEIFMGTPSNTAPLLHPTSASLAATTHRESVGRWHHVTMMKSHRFQ